MSVKKATTLITVTAVGKKISKHRLLLKGKQYKDRKIWLLCI